MKRTKDFDWSITRISNQTLSKQAEKLFMTKILAKELLPGSRIPSGRHLEPIMKVHRNTIGKVLHRLVENKWLVKIKGRFFVALDYPGSSNQKELITANFASTLKKPKLIPNISNIPYIGIAKDYIKSAESPFGNSIRDLNRHFKEGTCYSQIRNLDAYKSVELLHSIYNYLVLRNRFIIKEEQVAVIHERKACLDSVFKLLLEPGDIVVNTSYNDSTLECLLKFAGVETVFVDGSEEGFIARLETVFANKKVKVVHVRPQCSSLLGFTLSAKSGAELIALCKKYGVIILEEDDDHEFWYGEDPHVPLVSYPEQDNVIYIAALSKASRHLQSIRVVIAAQNFIEVLKTVPCSSIDLRDIVAEETLIDMMDSGRMREITDQLKETAVENRDGLAALYEANFGKEVSYTVPTAGLSIWVKFSGGINVYDLTRRLQANSIVVPYHPVQRSAGPTNFLRHGFGDFSHKEAKSFITALKEMIRNGEST